MTILNQNIANQVSFLRTSRNFPEDPHSLSLELSKSYIDIANSVNSRIIGIFPNNIPAITGESWYFSNRRQQTLRKVYNFGSIAAGTELDIPVNIQNFTSFTRIYGTVITTALDYRPLPYIDPGVLTTGMALLVGPVAGVISIRIVLGATAVPISTGIVILEWLSQV